jgi:hypothetical protein
MRLAWFQVQPALQEGGVAVELLPLMAKAGTSIAAIPAAARVTPRSAVTNEIRVRSIVCSS